MEENLTKMKKKDQKEFVCVYFQKLCPEQPKSQDPVSKLLKCSQVIEK